MVQKSEKILIVDDDELSARVLKAKLASKGFDVVLSASGEEALEKVDQETNLILLDIRMSGIDGYEVCRVLQSRESTRHIPIIFITGQREEESETKGLELGAVDYITKPFNMAIVEARIKTHLESKRRFDQLNNRSMELADINRRLEREIRERKRTEKELQAYRENLEELVKKRTAELLAANTYLEHEISERRKAEEALQISEEQFRNLVENSLVGILILQQDRMVYQNPEQKRIFSPLPDVYKPLDPEWIFSEDLEKIQWFFQPFEQGEPQTRETDYRFRYVDKRTKKERLKWVQCRATRFMYQGKDAVLVNMMDITRAKELEHLVMIKDKMASLGRIAAGIAHEIRNPLTGINSYLYTLENICNTEEIDLEHIEMIKQITGQLQIASNKIESVIKRVLDFSRSSMPKMKRINLNRSIEETLQLSSVTMRKSGIRISTRLEDSLPDCFADAHLMEQVFLNILNNSAKALENADMQKQIEVSTSSDSNRIMVKFSDNGPGIALELRQKIFDPFFTTYQDGSGIGLSIVQRILSDHKALVDVGTSKWGGAEFCIEMPIEKRNKSR